jgi:hypothetical protein
LTGKKCAIILREFTDENLVFIWGDWGSLSGYFAYDSEAEIYDGFE